MSKDVHFFIFVAIILLVAFAAFSSDLGKQLYSPAIDIEDNTGITLTPTTIVNNMNNIVQIHGVNFNPISVVTANGDELAWTLINNGLIELVFTEGTPVGNYHISVIDQDSSVHGPATLTINQPFSYNLVVNPSTAIITSGSTIDASVSLDIPQFSVFESVTVIATSASPQITATFAGSNSCIIETISSTCSMLVTVANIMSGDYSVDVDGVSSSAITSQFSMVLTSTNGNMCGNNLCEANENCDICSQDCGICPVLSTCGDNACTTGETCSSCEDDCGACVQPSGSSGGGGSGGSGGSSSGGSSGAVVRSQCSDGIDNDEDTLTDYPADTGCTDANDNNEVNIDPLITGNNEEESSNNGFNQLAEQPRQIRIIFWAVLVVLVAGIIVAGIVLVRSMRRRALYSDLAASVTETVKPTEI